MPRTFNVRRIGVALADIIVVCVAFALAFLLRFDFLMPAEYLSMMLNTLPYAVVIYSAVFIYFGSSFGQ